jgi:hypothetical protein
VDEFRDDKYFVSVGKEEAAIRPKFFKKKKMLFRIAASSFPLFPFYHCHPERIHLSHLQIFKCLMVDE